MGRGTNFQRAGGNVDRRSVVRDQLVLQTTDERLERSIEQAFIHYRGAQLHAGDAQELHVGTGKVVARVSPQDQDPAERRPRIVGGSDHLHGREALYGAPVVIRQRRRIHGARQIFLFEVTHVQIRETCPRGRMRIEGTFAKAALLVQDPLVLQVCDGTPRPHTDPGPATIANRRRVGRLDRYHRELVSRQLVLADGQCRGRHDVAVGLDVGELPQQLIRDRQASGPAGVIRSHEHDAGKLVIRQVVGERAHRLPDAARRVSAQ